MVLMRLLINVNTSADLLCLHECLPSYHSSRLLVESGARNSDSKSGGACGKLPH